MLFLGECTDSSNESGKEFTSLTIIIRKFSQFNQYLICYTVHSSKNLEVAGFLCSNLFFYGSRKQSF